MSIYARYSALLDGVLADLQSSGDLPADLNRRAVAVEPPRDASHGDLATNAAMVLAKPAGTNPRALAALIAPKLEALPGVTAVEVAGPGFINVRLSPDWLARRLEAVASDDRLGVEKTAAPQTVVVDYSGPNIAK